MTDLELARSVTAPGCVIECGVWKGGTSAGMAQVRGPDRGFLFKGWFDRTIPGSTPPEPIAVRRIAGDEGVARLKQFRNGLYYVVKGPRRWSPSPPAHAER